MRVLISWFLVTQIGAFCYIQLCGLNIWFLGVALWIGVAGGWVCATHDSGYNKEMGDG